MKNQQIDAAVIAYKSGNEQAFTALYRDWLCSYLHAFVANACSSVVGVSPDELMSLAHAVAAHATRTWKPGAGSCFKTWLCRIWRQRLASAIQANRSCKALAQRQTVSLDQLNCDGDCDLHENIADPLANSPAEIVM